jgi:YfiH family protein
VIPWEPPRGPYRIAFTTRRGGVSVGAYASLNLGRLTEDEPERVEENRRRAVQQLGAEPARLTLNRQVHGADVNLARPGSRGEPGDGLWTAEPGVPLLAIAADCLPIALARQDAVAVGVLHAGWRGLLAGIAEAGVSALGGVVAACVGPSIGPCCYRVGEDVAGPFRQAYGGDVVRDGRLDLWTAAERALRAAGVGSVERLDLCTSCNASLFFSHRRDAGLTGRQGVLALVA